MNNPFNFERLIYPFTKEQFVEEYLEQKPMVIKRNQPDYYHDLLTIEDVDDIIQSGFHHGNLNCTLSHAEKKIEPEDYKTIRRTDKTDIYTGLDPARLFKLFEQQKATMIIHNSVAYNTALADMVTKTESALHCQSGVNLFVTPSNAQCFQAHYDEHDLFIIQIGGVKHWKVFENAVYLPFEPQNKKRVDFSGLALLHDVYLEAGDLLYVPRGFVHEVTTTDTISFHITLGAISEPWIKHFANYITALAFEDEAFRRSYVSEKNRTDKESGALIAQLKQKIMDKLKEDDVRRYIKMKMAEPKTTAATLPSLAQMANETVYHLADPIK